MCNWIQTELLEKNVLPWNKISVLRSLLWTKGERKWARNSFIFILKDCAAKVVVSYVHQKAVNLNRSANWQLNCCIVHTKSFQFDFNAIILDKQNFFFINDLPLWLTSCHNRLQFHCLLIASRRDSVAATLSSRCHHSIVNVNTRC